MRSIVLTADRGQCVAAAGGVGGGGSSGRGGLLPLSFPSISAAVVDV